MSPGHWLKGVENTRHRAAVQFHPSAAHPGIATLP